MKKCDVLIELKILSDVMSEMCCCKSGRMLKSSKDFAKAYEDKLLEEKMKLLEHISQP